LRTNHLETSTIDRRTALKTLATIPFAISGIPIAQLVLDGWTPLWNGRDLAGWDTYLGRPHRASDTDRNKSSLALMSLTEPRDPALLSTLRDKAVPALTEMARWKSRGHALASVMILGRVAGIPERDLTSAAEIGSHATIVNTALQRLAAK
jgi:hypothetical protein